MTSSEAGYPKYVRHYSGLFVSDQGHIKRKINDTPSRGFDNQRGYLYVNVKDPSGIRLKSGKPRWIKKYVHRLIYEAFYDQVIPEGLDVHHINGVRNDNRLSNLMLLSRGDNLEEAFGRRSWNEAAFDESDWHC